MRNQKQASPELPVKNHASRIDDGGPSWFPLGLLKRSKAARLAYFESKHVQVHDRLKDVCSAVIGHICPPGNNTNYRRPPKMVLLIGPARVGKTTALALIIAALLKRAKARMNEDKGYVPVVYITLDAERTFDWGRFYRAVLEALGDPFLKMRKWATEAELQAAMESALIQRKVEVIIIDEAQHLAKATRMANIQNQLDKLKHFQNKLRVSFILAGTYEMEPFRSVNAQLACRTVDVHFRRYDARVAEERTVFQSVLWAFQRQMPLPVEPQLDHFWRFLYDRSLGCVGILKELLNEALKLALEEGAQTVTQSHLRRASLPKVKLQLELDAILDGEADLVDAEAAAAKEEVEEWFLSELGLTTPSSPQKPAESEKKTEPVLNKTEKSSPPQSTGKKHAPPPGQSTQKRRPGEPNPKRTRIGLPDEGRTVGGQENLEQEAG